MIHSQPALRLKVAGPVRLTGPDGRDLTPRAARGRALLAILAVSPGHARSRAWIQDKLWSDREPAQGAGSLRQLLTELRDAMGEFRVALRTGQGSVGLDQAMVRVELNASMQDLELNGEEQEFAAGLDVPDPEFEDWLRDTRAAYERRRTGAGFASRNGAGTVVVIAPADAEAGPLRTLADMVAAEIAERMSAVAATVAVFDPTDQTVWRGAALSLHVRAVSDRDGATVQAQWREPTRGAVLATVRRVIRHATARPGQTGPVDLMVSEATIAGILELGKRAARRLGDEAEGAAHRALGAIPAFTSPASAVQCDRLLALAAQSNDAAVLRAYRAQVRIIAWIERMPGMGDNVAEEAIALSKQAIEDDPANPLVRAIAGDVALHFERRPEKAMALASSAVERDPANPLIRGSFAQALAWRGDNRRAHVEALNALKLAAGHPRIAWWHMRCGVTAVRRGLYADALRFALTAHELAPSFRPPLRFMAALRFHLGDEAGAVEALMRLKALEPDFSLALMGSDDYPVASLRATPLIGITRSGLL